MLLSSGCEVASVLFVVTVLLAIVGNVTGVMAWRRRSSEYSRWRWLTDPTYAFRKNYYREPDQVLRKTAMVCLGAGYMLALTVFAFVMIHLVNGESTVCGFQF